jgi:hypothetical protein
MDYYVDNTNSEFRNYLWNSIPLDGTYFCGLLSIDFADDFTLRRVQAHPKYPDIPPSQRNPVLVPPKTTNEPTTTEGSVFFGDKSDSHSFYGEDNKVLVKTESVNQISLKKEEGESWTNFLSKVKLTLNRLQFVELNTLYDKKSEYPTAVITIKDPNKEEYFLHISSELAVCLGFSERTFYEGRYEAPNKVSEEGYLLLNEGKVTCNLNRWINKFVELNEPSSDPTGDKIKFIEEVIEDVVLSHSEQGILISMPISLDGVISVEIEDLKPRHKFKLPKVLNKVLGLDEDYFFEKNVEIYLDEREQFKPKPPTQVELDRNKIISNALPNQILVLSDIIESSNYGPFFRPILRCFTRERGIRIPHSREFYPVQFHRVICKELKEIKITLTDPSFLPLREILYPTSVVLKFVKQPF